VRCTYITSDLKKLVIDILFADLKKKIIKLTMEKKVYYLIEGRCKCIKFTPEKNVSEVEIIRNKLQEVRKTDNVLNMMLQQKMIILQRPDPDRDNKLCDLEDDDEIPDKSEVTVLLIPVRANTTTELIDSFSSVHKDNESVVKVLYTVPIDDDNNSSSNLVDIQQLACHLVS